MRVLEVSLRKAGFTVTTATSVQDALDKLELDAPDLIISETTFTDGDGFELRRRVRTVSDWGEIPFIFLTAEAAIENKIRGLELGVDDYLTKPIYIKEIVTRINILLQKRQRTRFEERRDGRTRFAGRVVDMPVVDVIQTIEISRKSGVIQFIGERGRQAAIYFRDGRVIDAEAGTLQGEDAVYRLLTWNEGSFEVGFRTVRRREAIGISSQALLMEGMRRLDEWSRLLEQLPSLSHRFEVDADELSVRLGDVPDEHNQILRLLDGNRTLMEVIEASDVGDLECLQAISRLYFEEMLVDIDHGAPVRHPSGRPVPLVEVEGPTPIDDTSSGPIEVGEPRHESVALSQVVASEPDPDATPSPAREDATNLPLLGRFRPSSLRLIDEAVAAADALEPSFDDERNLPVEPPEPLAFADEDATPTPLPPRRARNATPQLSGNGVHATLHDATPLDELAGGGKVPRAAHEENTSPPRGGHTPVERPSTAGKDDSGLRMIGSAGRDRAETSGELTTDQNPSRRSTTERELVTILPRRRTGEVSTVSIEDIETAAAATNDLPTPTPAPAIPAAAVQSAAAGDRGTPPRELPPPPVRRRFMASGVRRDTGPGLAAILLIALAAVLAGIAVYLRLHRTPRHAPAVVMDAEVAIAETDADVTPPPSLSWNTVDATLAEVPTDTAAEPPPAAVDAGVIVAAPDAAPPIDTLAEARKLVAQANEALQEGDFAKARELADESLALRRTSRGYLMLALALQRLGGVDEALQAIAEAEQITPNASILYDQKGRILWAAGRKDEAREAFQHFLDMDPENPRAEQIQRLLNEPR